MIAGTVKDGFGISVGFGATALSGLMLVIDPDSVTPPGADVGDGIPTTTHSNTLYRTKSPKTLIDITNAKFTAAYDPDQWALIVTAINLNNLITFTFGGGQGSQAFWGYLKSFVPSAWVEGEQPKAECEIVATNTDDSGAEAAPSFDES